MSFKNSKDSFLNTKIKVKATIAVIDAFEVKRIAKDKDDEIKNIKFLDNKYFFEQYRAHGSKAKANISGFIVSLK